jgi:hypothetical protein
MFTFPSAAMPRESDFENLEVKELDDESLDFSGIDFFKEPK